MKTINILLPMVVSTILLTGCYQSVNIRDIQDAAAICGKLENIVEIHAHGIGHEVVECINRVSYNIDSSNLKGK
jgi:hypothetical protein